MTLICFVKVWRIIHIGRSLWKTQSSCLIKAGPTSLSEFVVQGFTLRSFESLQGFSRVLSLSLLRIYPYGKIVLLFYGIFCCCNLQWLYLVGPGRR